MPQSVLDSGVVRLTELTINQNELIDLASAVTTTSTNSSSKSHNSIVNSTSISNLFDDMDFIKSVELQCLTSGKETDYDNCTPSTSTTTTGLLTTLHHNGG